MTNIDNDHIDVCVQAFEIGMFDHVIDGLTTVENCRFVWDVF